MPPMKISISHLTLLVVFTLTGMRMTPVLVIRVLCLVMLPMKLKNVCPLPSYLPISLIRRLLTSEGTAPFGGQDPTPKPRLPVNATLRMEPASPPESTLLSFLFNTLRRFLWKLRDKTLWIRLSTQQSLRNTSMPIPFSTLTPVVTLLLVALWVMLALLAERSLLTLMAVGALMVVELSLARITQRLTVLLLTQPDGWPRAWSRLVFAVVALFRLLMPLVCQSLCLSPSWTMEAAPSLRRN